MLGLEVASYSRYPRFRRHDYRGGGRLRDLREPRLLALREPRLLALREPRLLALRELRGNRVCVCARGDDRLLTYM